MRRSVVVSFVAGCALAIAGPAVAATEIGHTCVPFDGSPGTEVQSSTSPLSPSYAVPAGGGVITSWKAEGGGFVFSTKFKVLRPTGDPAKFLVVGQSTVTPFPLSGVSEFPVRIPVAAGDLLGYGGFEPSKFVCTSPNASDGTRYANAEDQPPGATTTLNSTSPNILMDVAAKVEPDADGDDFGDETQDQCPSDKSTQGPCPLPPATIDKTAPNLSFSGKTTQKLGSSVAVAVACNEACDLSANGTVSTKKVSTSATYKLAGATAKLIANTKTTLKVKISKKKRKRITRALKNGRRATATVTIVAKDAAGNAKTAKRKIKLKR